MHFFLFSGIGSIPDAVLSQLGHHKNLGVHSEMFSDGVVELVEKGVITNTEKSILTGRLVSSFSIGTKILYNFLDNNASVGKQDVSLGLVDYRNNLPPLSLSFFFLPLSSFSLPPSLLFSLFLFHTVTVHGYTCILGNRNCSI